jgi:insulysin
MLGHFST